MMKEIVKSAALATPFSLLISILYLQGYWGEFNIPIFSLVPASEILVRSAIPFVGIMVFSAIGVLVGYSVHLFEKRVKEEHGSLSLLKLALLRIWDVLGVLTIGLLIAKGGYAKWYVLPGVLTLVVMYFLFKTKAIEKIPGNDFKRCR